MADDGQIRAPAPSALQSQLIAMDAARSKNVAAQGGKLVLPTLKKASNFIHECNETSFEHTRIGKVLPPIDLRLKLSEGELAAERARRTLRFDEQYRISHYENQTKFPNVSEVEVEMGTNGLHAYQQKNEGTGCGNWYCCCLVWCWPLGLLYLLTECLANKKYHCCGSHDVIHVDDSDVVVRKGSHVLVRHGRHEDPPFDQTEAYMAYMKSSIGQEIMNVRKNTEKMAEATKGHDS